MKFFPNFFPTNIKYKQNSFTLFIIFSLILTIFSIEPDNFPLINISPGLYALQLSIGYPQHNFLLLVDTSSKYTWVRGTNCTFCAYTDNIYDEEASISVIHQDEISYTTMTDIKGSVSGNILYDDIKIGDFYATKVELLVASEDEYQESADGVLSLKYPKEENDVRNIMEKKKLYTLLVYSENVAGILNQVTAVFTRRQVNIESLNVSASSIPGVHKYTITAWSDEDQIIKIARQIEKKIDVVKANYFTDDQLFIRESGLYKLSTEKLMENPEISRTIRRFDASITEVNPTYVIVMKYGLTEDIISLFRALDAFGCVLQYTRSGRIAVTRGMQEQVSEFLEEREKQNG